MGPRGKKKGAAQCSPLRKRLTSIYIPAKKSAESAPLQLQKLMGIHLLFKITSIRD